MNETDPTAATHGVVGHECIACGGTGRIAHFCRQYSDYPGTIWDPCHNGSGPDLGHHWDYGHLCCRNCKGDYNSHGAPADIMKRFNVPDGKGHLICGQEYGPCVLEDKHLDQHMDRYGKRW